MTYIIMVAAVAFAVALFATPVFSLSSNQCSSCHGSTYNQQLDILEGNSQNILPSTIMVGQTASVAVAIQNINNAPPLYNQFSSVTATLSSQSGHFSVSNPNFNIGKMPTGTSIATWQITGVSQGSDVFLISSSAKTIHENLHFSDVYSPSLSITITFNPDLTPTPTPAPTTIPTSTPMPSPTPPSPSNPTAKHTPTQTQTPTQQPTNSPYTQTPTPTSNSNPSATPITQSPSPTSYSHSLDSQMFYIHPPIAIFGYVLIFLFAFLVLKKNYLERRITKITGMGLWLFTLLGLLTGMLWAQLAWGSYWSWGLKETLTLVLFLTASVGQVAFFEKKFDTAKWVAVFCCILVIITGLSSFIIAGLHSYT